jgi:hypothetical protein
MTPTDTAPQQTQYYFPLADSPNDPVGRYNNLFASIADPKLVQPNIARKIINGMAGIADMLNPTKITYDDTKNDASQ